MRANRLLTRQQGLPSSGTAGDHYATVSAQHIQDNRLPLSQFDAASLLTPDPRRKKGSRSCRTGKGRNDVINAARAQLINPGASRSPPVAENVDNPSFEIEHVFAVANYLGWCIRAPQVPPVPDVGEEGGVTQVEPLYF